MPYSPVRQKNMPIPLTDTFLPIPLADTFSFSTPFSIDRHLFFLFAASLSSQLVEGIVEIRSGSKHFPRATHCRDFMENGQSVLPPTLLAHFAFTPWSPD